MTARTFPELLEEQLRRNGGRPLVTFYDDDSGERTELSVLTYANWVAKTASLVQDELGIERGATVAVDLPTHWLGVVWLGACWTVGAGVTTDRGRTVDLVVCGPEALATYAGADVPVVALSLDPMGRAFTEPLPPGVLDYGAVVWGQPDAFTPLEPPEPDDLAWLAGAHTATQAELLAGAARRIDAPRHRVMTDHNPCSEPGVACFVGPLHDGGGTVWVRSPDADAWRSRVEGEHVTYEVRSPAA